MAAFVTHVTLEDLEHLARPDPDDLSGKTPSQKATAEARAKGYDGICLPLTNDRWKARWRELCLLHPEGNPDAAALEQSAENWRAKPGFLRDEVTITRLGAQWNPVGLILTAETPFGADEAENSIILLSDWLELDAADAWVRHDAEIVRRFLLSRA